MKRNEIMDLSNTELIIMLCKLYHKRTKAAESEARLVIEELGRRGLVYEEDLTEDYFK